MESVEGARAVAKALQILEVFSVEHPWRTVAELAHLSGLPPTTTARLVAALERANVLQREPRGFRYAPGFRTMGWASVARASSSFPEIAHPHVRALSESTGETAALYVRQGHNRVCIDVVNSTQQVHRAIPLGEVAPLNQGAAGRVIAAYLPDEERQQLGFTRDDWDRLQKVPSFGLVCTVRDRLKDAWAAASPIHDAHGEVHSALLLTGPVSRWSPELFKRFGPSVRATAHEVEQRLGFLAGPVNSSSLDGVPVFGNTSIP